jgi:hypothetical protein
MVAHTHLWPSAVLGDNSLRSLKFVGKRSRSIIDRPVSNRISSSAVGPYQSNRDYGNPSEQYLASLQSASSIREWGQYA